NGSVHHTSGNPTAGSPADETSRKRTHASPSDNIEDSPIGGRKAPKVSRACDRCKTKKLRCSGTIPCRTCSARRTACLYSAAYRRGRPPTPQATPTAHESAGSAQDSGVFESPVPRPPETHGRHVGDITRPQNSIASEENATDGRQPMSRGSPELGEAEMEGQYFDSTSSLSFLHRAWKRLLSQETTPRIFNGVEQHQSMISAGDKPFMLQGGGASTLSLDENSTRDLLRFYFNNCVVTYRCLHQGYVTKWLDTVLANARHDKPLWLDIGHARAAIVLTTLAIAMLRRTKVEVSYAAYAEITNVGEACSSDTYFCTAADLTTAETGLPTLESAQARLLQVLYLLQTSRMNQAWYVFGSILPIMSALGLHRRSRRNRTLAGNGTKPRFDYIVSQCGKRTFWVAYTIDKYLAVVLGRPRFYHEDDCNQEFPDNVNDEDMTPQGRAAHEPQVDCHVDSLICHVKLAQLIERTTKEVYSLKPISTHERLEAARRCGEALHTWHESLPPHLGAVRPLSLAPIFCRQATALKLAYCHAIMHANRPFLLGADSVPAERDGLTPLDDSVEECLSAARTALETVDSMSQDSSLFYALWWTPYVTFCALAVVYVWEIQNRQSDAAADLLKLAERCHSHLELATATDSPSRRYGIILKELQQEAKYQSALSQSEQTGQPEGNSSAANLPGTSVAHPIDASLAAADEIEVGQSPLADSFLEAWQTTDWLDLDSSAFGPFPDFEDLSVFWN
ncbi:fungal-specific transcription factor domain-containing protein, partial [Diaporthe sp. PMI_573]